MMEQTVPVVYDNAGRMKYNPDLHDRQGKPWDDEEKEYLIKWYTIIGLEEMSLALGRTEGTIASKVYLLRIQGKMSKEFQNHIIRELKPKSKRKYFNTGRPKKLDVDIGLILELKKSKNNVEIAEIINVSVSTITRRISEYKKATKNPDQSVQSSIGKNSPSLYHTNGGMQVAN